MNQTIAPQQQFLAALDDVCQEGRELATKSALVELKFELEHRDLFLKEAGKLSPDKGVQPTDMPSARGTIRKLIERNRKLRERAQRAEAHISTLDDHIQKYINGQGKRKRPKSTASATLKILRQWYPSMRT